LGLKLEVYKILFVSSLPPGSKLEILGCVYDDADFIRFDLQCHPTVRLRHKVETLRNISLHINPRFIEHTVVFNTMENGEWMEETKESRMALKQGADFKLVIR
jgi:tectonin beta-propeller repeat-containing protein 1